MNYFTGTGSHIGGESYKDEVYTINEYEVTVRLTENNKFIAIKEIRTKRNFYNYQNTIGSHDVDEFYKDDID